MAHGESIGARHAGPIPWIAQLTTLLRQLREAEMAELTEETVSFFDEMLDLQEEIADSLLEIRDLLAKLVGQEQHRKTPHVRRVRERK